MPAAITATSNIAPRYSGLQGKAEERLSKVPFNARLQMAKDAAAQIKQGDHRYSLNVVKVVSASNYDPQIMEAARSALSPITSWKDDPRWPHAEQWPFTQFGFDTRRAPKPLAHAYDIVHSEKAPA